MKNTVDAGAIDIIVTAFHEPAKASDVSSVVIERKGSRFTRRGLAITAVAALATVGAINFSQQTLPDQAEPTTPTPQLMPTDTLTEIAPSSAATIEKPKMSQSLEYFTNGYRSKAIQDVVQAKGKKIVKALETNQLGTVDFFNAQTNEWQSQSKETTGWGWLSHNPQDGGSPDQVSAYVYRNVDGSFDLIRGIPALGIKVTGKPSVMLESPTVNIVPSTITPDYGWNITVSNGTEITSARTIAYTNTSTFDDILAVDNIAMAQVSDYADRLSA